MVKILFVMRLVMLGEFVVMKEEVVTRNKVC